MVMGCGKMSAKKKREDKGLPKTEVKAIRKKSPEKPRPSKMK